MRQHPASTTGITAQTAGQLADLRRDALGRARAAGPGPERSDLRQIAVALRWLCNAARTTREDLPTSPRR